MMDIIREMVLRALVELVIKDLLENGLRPGDADKIAMILANAENLTD